MESERTRVRGRVAHPAEVVVSHTLKEVGPNATLINGKVEAAVRELKTEHAGEIEVAVPELAQSLTALGLIDEYRLYFNPVVLGKGKPFSPALAHRCAWSPTI